MEKQISKGQVINNKNVSAVVVENNEEVLKLFILNGFYTYEKDKINNKNYLHFIREDEKIPESNFTLNGFNLGFNKKSQNYNIDLNDCEIRDFTIEDKEDFFNNLKRVNKNKVDSSYFNLRDLNQISKAFNKYYDYKNIPIVDCKVGDIFKDNLLTTKFFDEDNHLGLKENYWIIVEVDKYDKKYFAIHTEYLVVAQFNWIGKIEKLVNDVDSRFGKCRNGLPKSALFCNYNYECKEKVTVSGAYYYEDIDENHFFYDIKLVGKVDFNDDQNEALSYNLLYKHHYHQFNSPKIRNWIFRNYTDDLMTEFFGKAYLGYVDIYDGDKNKMAEPIYHHNIKEQFVFNDFEEKTTAMLSLLGELIINKNKQYCNSNDEKNFINIELKRETEELMRLHYNKYFDKMIEKIPEIKPYLFKKEGKLEEFVDFINKKRKEKIGNIMDNDIDRKYA